MKIRGPRGPDGHYYLPCLMFCTGPEFVKPLLFLVDSGATVTTVIAEKLEIVCNELEKGNATLSSKGLHTPI